MTFVVFRGSEGIKWESIWHLICYLYFGPNPNQRNAVLKNIILASFITLITAQGIAAPPAKPTAPAAKPPAPPPAHWAYSREVLRDLTPRLEGTWVGTDTSPTLDENKNCRVQVFSNWEGHIGIIMKLGGVFQYGDYTIIPDSLIALVNLSEESTPNDKAVGLTFKNNTYSIRRYAKGVISKDKQDTADITFNGNSISEIKLYGPRRTALDRVTYNAGTCINLRRANAEGT